MSERVHGIVKMSDMTGACIQGCFCGIIVRSTVSQGNHGLIFQLINKFHGTFHIGSKSDKSNAISTQLIAFPKEIHIFFEYSSISHSSIFTPE